MRRLTFALAATALFAAPTQAQEQDGPWTTLTTAAGIAELAFQPANCSPELDCPSFILLCTDGELELRVRNLVVAHVERWALESEPATLRIGFTELRFEPERMTQHETWNWMARLHPDGDWAPLLEAMPEGGSVRLVTPFYTFALEPTETDILNMGAFGIGCLAAATG